LLLGWGNNEVTFRKGPLGTDVNLTGLKLTSAGNLSCGLSSLRLKLGFCLLFLLVLPFQVVLSKIAVLAHATRVVRPIGMATGMSHLGLSLSVIAVVAHVLGVVLLVSMWALEDLSSLPLAWNSFFLRNNIFLGIESVLSLNMDTRITWFIFQ
jgi:hypothetical protein